MPILAANFQDIPKLVTLINSAYRGEYSKNGWTTEADLIRGDLRIDEPGVEELMQANEARFLKYLNDRGEMEGCVYIQKRKESMYLGLLTVSPTQQAKGIGKQLMN